MNERKMRPNLRLSICLAAMMLVAALAGLATASARRGAAYAEYYAPALEYSYNTALGGYTVDGFDETSPSWTEMTEAQKANVAIVIPETYHGSRGEAPVVRIRERAFWKTGMSDVTVTWLDLSAATHLQSIGTSAFSDQNSMKGSIVLPAGLTEINNSAFSNCSSLTGDLILSDNVTKIGSMAFERTGLDGTLRLPKNPTYTKIENYTFRSSKFSGALEIPATVESIGKHAFYYCERLTGLTIPDSVTYIDQYAFIGCKSLTGGLTLPAGLTTLGDQAFAECSKLTGTLSIPGNLSVIPQEAFRNCSSLTGLQIAGGVTSIGEKAFQFCFAMSGDLTIPDTVASVGAGAFTQNGFSGTLTLPDNDQFTAIGANTFQGCKFAGELILPAALTTIEQSAFSGCKNLPAVQFNPALTTVGKYAFQDCIALQRLSFQGQVNLTFGSSAFSGCTGLKQIEIDPQVLGATLYSSAFPYDVPVIIPDPTLYDSVLTGVLSTVKSQVTYETEVSFYLNAETEPYARQTKLYKKTFQYVRENGLWSVDSTYRLPTKDLPGHKIYGLFDAAADGNQVYYYSAVQYAAYYYRSELILPFTSVFAAGAYTITGYNPEYLKMLDDKAHVAVTIPATYDDGTSGSHPVAAIGAQAFLRSKYTDLGVTFTSLDLAAASELRTIGDEAFRGCSSMTGALVFPAGLQTIGAYAFSSCSGLTGGLTLPESVTAIGSHAFSSCRNFQGTLQLPSGLREVPDNAFFSCTGFEALSLPAGLRTVGAEAFGNCTGLTGVLTLPSNLISIGDAAFKSCNFTGKLVLPGSVTAIAENAFQFCAGLTHIEFLQFGLTTALPASAFPAKKLILLPDADAYQDAAAAGLLANVSDVAAYVIEVTFYLDDAAEPYARQTKLFAQSLQYEQGGDGVWTENTSYQLPLPEKIPQGRKAVGMYTEQTGGTAVYSSSQVTQGKYIYRTAAILPFEVSFAAGEYTIKRYRGEYLQSLDDPAKVPIVIPATYDDGRNGEHPVAAIGMTAFLPSYYEAYTFVSLDFSAANFLRSIGNSAFSGCAAVAGELTLPASLQTIDSSAFQDCTGLTKLQLPSGLTTIGTFAFAGCTGLSGALTLPGGLKQISGSAFKGCANLTGALEIPFGVETVGSYAFQNCAGFSSLTLADSILKIGSCAFDGCGGFRGALTLPKDLTAIENGVFRNCAGFTGRVAIPAGVTELENEAFKGCSNLKQFEFSNPDIAVTPDYGMFVDALLLFADKEAYDKAIAGSFSLTAYRSLLAYETEVKFYHNNASEPYKKEAKLYNKPFGYEKDAAGLWHLKTAYDLPKETLPAHHTDFGMFPSLDPKASAVTASRSVLQNAYYWVTQIVFTRIEADPTNLEEVSYNDPLSALKGLVVVGTLADGTTLPTEDYTVAFWNGGTTFQTGSNYLIVTYSNRTAAITCSLSVDAAKIQVVKPTVQGTYVYRGEPQSPELADFDRATMRIFTGDVATDADTYLLVVELLDPDNYAWAGGPADRQLELEWVIERAAVAVRPQFDAEARVYVGGSLPAILSDQSELGRIAWDEAALNEPSAGREFGWTWHPYDEKNYNEATGTASFAVLAVELDRIAAAFTPGENKVYSNAATDLLKKWLAVTGINNDGSTFAVADYTLEGDLSVAGERRVTVRYAGKEDTVVVTVTAVALEGLAVTTAPTKTAYIAFEDFDDSGMVVTATFNYGAEIVESYTVAGRESLRVGTVALTISYEFEGVTKETTVTITVAKASYDMGSIVFADISLREDGAPHALAISGTLPAGVTVSYAGTDGYSTAGATAPGVYLVTATFAVADADNYNVPEAMTAKLTVKRAQVVKEESVGEAHREVVVVESERGLEPDVVLSAEDVTEAERDKVDPSSLYKEQEVKQIFDVRLLQNGAAIESDGALTIRLFVDESLRGDEHLGVFRLTADGVAEAVNAVLEGDYLVFTVSGPAMFVLVGEASDTAFAVAVAVTILFWLLTLVGIVYLVCYYRKKRRTGGTPGEPDGEDNAPEPGEGKKGSDKTYSVAPLMFSAAVLPAGLLAAMTSGIVAFAVVAGLNVYVRARDGSLRARLAGRRTERLASAPDSEETAEPEADPATPELPKSAGLPQSAEYSQSAGEPAATTVRSDAREKPVDPAKLSDAAESPIEPAQSADLDVDDCAQQGPVATVAGHREPFFRFGGVVYHRSFLAKLIQGSEANKRYYDILKNEFLSYKRVRSSMSFERETFLLGRRRLAVMAIVGKTLKLYLALDPRAVERKYAARDAGGKKTYARTPCCIRVRSDTGLRKMIFLISQLMKENGAEFDPEYRRTNLSALFPYEETEALLARGLIKRTVFGNDASRRADLSMLIRQKITVAEAQSALSDEAAAALVEKSEDADAHGWESVCSGKKAVVNIDTLSANFAENELVTLDALKERGLIAKNVAAVKVLARGTLDKPLIVEAQDFSLDAVRMIVLTGGRANRTGRRTTR